MAPIYNSQKSFAFGLRAFKKYPEILPMVVVVGAAVIGSVVYGFYSLTKLDVVLNRKNELPPWERIDLLNPKIDKFLVMNQECKPNPELIALKKEMK